MKKSLLHSDFLKYLISIIAAGSITISFINRILYNYFWNTSIVHQLEFIFPIFIVFLFIIRKLYVQFTAVFQKVINKTNFYLLLLPIVCGLLWSVLPFLLTSTPEWIIPPIPLKSDLRAYTIELSADEINSITINANEVQSINNKNQLSILEYEGDWTFFPDGNIQFSGVGTGRLVFNFQADLGSEISIIFNTGPEEGFLHIAFNDKEFSEIDLREDKPGKTLYYKKISLLDKLDILLLIICIAETVSISIILLLINGLIIFVLYHNPKEKFLYFYKTLQRHFTKSIQIFEGKRNILISRLSLIFHIFLIFKVLFSIPAFPKFSVPEILLTIVFLNFNIRQLISALKKSNKEVLLNKMGQSNKISLFTRFTDLFSSRVTNDLIFALLLAIIIVSICLYMAPRGSDKGFVDVAHDGYQLRTSLDLKQGGLLFRDTFTQYGIFPDYLNMFALMLFGERLLSLKYMACLMYGLLIICQYYLNRVFLPAEAAFIAGLGWIMLGPYYIHGIMVSAHLYAVPFQIISILLIFSYIKKRTSWPLILSGIATGFMFGMKQNIGIFHIVTVCLFLFIYELMDKQEFSTVWRRIIMMSRSLLFFAAGFLLIIGPALLWLAFNGVLDDWYLQTIKLGANYAIDTTYNISLPDLPIPIWLTDFIERVCSFFYKFYKINVLLPNTALYSDHIIWYIFRLVVFAFGGWMLIKRSNKDFRVIFLSLVALFGWLGALPSNNFIHQWWILTPVYGMFVYILWKLVSSRLHTDNNILLLALLLGNTIDQPFQKRINILETNTVNGKWDVVLEKPAVLQGIRTNKSWADLNVDLLSKISTYSQDYPSASLITMGDPWSGSLLFQSYIEQGPTIPYSYWDVEYVFDTVYPNYYDEMENYIRQNHPIIVTESSLISPEYRELIYCAPVFQDYEIKDHFYYRDDINHVLYYYSILTPHQKTTDDDYRKAPYIDMPRYRTSRFQSVDVQYENGLRLIGVGWQYVGMDKLQIDSYWMTEQMISDGLYLSVEIEGYENGVESDKWLVPVTTFDFDRSFGILCPVIDTYGGTESVLMPGAIYRTSRIVEPLIGQEISSENYSIWLSVYESYLDPIKNDNAYKILPVINSDKLSVDHKINLGSISLSISGR